jgi:hypothetical protein
MAPALVAMAPALMAPALVATAPALMVPALVALALMVPALVVIPQTLVATKQALEVMLPQPIPILKLKTTTRMPLVRRRVVESP